ncbi:precorrin-8X methylmutase [Klebsiella pneumoniae]|nr:precorrin-8X methylmutase [Klebsiella pneumoniae]
MSRPLHAGLTDTTMALSGINKTLLARFGGECRAAISTRPAGGARGGAKPRRMTRSMAAVDVRCRSPGKCSSSTYANRAVSPAGTSRDRHRRRGEVPVGFVGAAERRSARALPTIAALGRKGATWRQRCERSALHHLREAQ